MKGFPYLLVALLVGGCIPREETPPQVYLAPRLEAPPSPVSLGGPTQLGPKKETSVEYLARMCKDTAAGVTRSGEESEFSYDVWNCEQQNPELARTLKAEHEKFLVNHPIKHYYGDGSVLSESGYEPPKAPDLFEEAEKAQQQIYHDEEIRSQQQLLDWALEPMGR
jgi:hypothetical protein